jgi:chemotaxis protein CheY-P-specific phosphatase CheC
MHQLKKLDKIIQAVETRIQDEVGVLLGADFTLISGNRKSVGKKAAFDSRQGKQICARMDITGEVTGQGCLLMGIKDAIRLGGTLIMLPAGELEEVIGREEYSEEIEDSYGEIANIIAGAFTRDFEEMYPKSCRFVRKEQEIVVPAKVDVETDRPVADQTYYQVSSSMVLDGRQLGEMVMLMPAAAFGLSDQEKIDEPDAASGKSGAVDRQNDVKAEDIPGLQVEGTPATPVTGLADQARKSPAVGPKLDPAKHEKKINGLLDECRRKMESEVAALLGADITLGDPENRLLDRDEFLQDHVAGRQVLADMDVTGEAQGKSYLAVSIKDAIQLGGILIMLPPTELEKVVKEEDFGEDARDAYGEIANIISGVLTAVFEEQHRRKLRFIRKELRDIDPARPDDAADRPLPDKSYYTSSIPMAVAGKPLGRIHLLFPADLLGFETSTAKTDPAPLAGAGRKATAPDEQPLPEKGPNRDLGSPAPAKTGKDAPLVVQGNVKKQQNRVDKVLAACRERMAEEVSALLGTDIKLTNLENMLVSKEEFFVDQVSGKQLLANLDVIGEPTGRSYLSVGLRDAIRIGGELIMLPSAELESVVAEEAMSEDVQDAYGEIANIIAGVYTAVFEEHFTRQLRFVKTDLQQVTPMKVDIDGDRPIPNRDYYLSRMDLTVGELGLGKVNILFPADLLQLSGLRPESIAGAEDEDMALFDRLAAELEKPDSQAAPTIEATEINSPDILVVNDDEPEAAKIATVLGDSGYTVKTLSFKDNLHNYIPGNLKAIYLVMQDVDEQAFGVAIKISSACSVPLIAAGPGWTRTKVIKAVKYGVRDILLTPASEEDIEESVNNNLLELAA